MSRQFLKFIGGLKITLAACWLTAAVALAQTTQLPPDTGGNPAADNRPDQFNGGGVTQNDFDPLLDLIRGTINTDLWEQGSATLQPYVNGVFADADGTLRFASSRPNSATAKKGGRDVDRPKLLDRAGRRPQRGNLNQSVNRDSGLRFISLRRLENLIAQRLEQRQPLPEEVLTLAGLQRIRYIIVVPAEGNDQGDLVLAGPAGGWQTNPNGIIVSTKTGFPTLRLDDLLTLWRRDRPTEPFGVTIEPRAVGLKSLQQYLRLTTTKPIKPAKRERWVEGLRKNVGKQDVKYFGLRPESHVARVLLTADYHMKCIGMGLADPVDGVQSYLNTIELDRNGQVPPMTVLRWWFAMNYEPVEVSENNQVFEISGPGAKVLSENQLLDARGQRVVTGKSEPLNRLFADSFTKQFSTICDEYPVYGELKNIFDLAMTLAVVQRQQLLDRAGWNPRLLLDGEALKLPEVKVAAEVEPIVNHRVIDGKQIVAGVSGGVWVDAKKHLELDYVTADLDVDVQIPTTVPGNTELAWWWD